MSLGLAGAEIDLLRHIAKQFRFPASQRCGMEEKINSLRAAALKQTSLELYDFLEPELYIREVGISSRKITKHISLWADDFKKALEFICNEDAVPEREMKVLEIVDHKLEKKTTPTIPIPTRTTLPPAPTLSERELWGMGEEI